MNNIKKDFPIFSNYPDLIYLDNASTTQKPQIMIDALSEYYQYKNSNIGRGLYKLAEISENCYEESRKIVADFVGTNKKNIIFTGGATESLNQVSFICGQLLKPKQKIVLSIFEHHANILPWQKLAKEKNLELVFIEDYEIIANPENLPIDFWNNIGVISLSHVSNVTGQIHPIKKWCELAKKYNILICIDGAQGVVSEIINLQELNCDFYSFSSHKLYGPMGVGVLYINNLIINSSVEPLILGGGIIEDVLKNSYILTDNSSRFESGTPNVADVYALGKTIEYLLKNNWNNLLLQCHELNEYLILQLEKIEKLHIINSSNLSLSHMASFTVEGIHSHDIGTFLANSNISVRVGKHCTHTFHDFLKINSSIRVSIGIYNTKNDIDYLIEKIYSAFNFFKV